MHHDDRPGGAAARTAEGIASELGRRPAAALVRSGANEVFTVDDLVIRLAPPGVDVANHVRAASVLAGHGMAIPELVASGVVNERAFTAWERVEADRGAGLDFRQLGAEIGRLHRIDPDAAAAEMALPWCDEAQWLDLDPILDAAEAADVVLPGDIGILRGCWEQLRSWGDRCRAAGGPPVVCHGDVHPGNVIMRRGRPVVVDWDTICLGPPQWDHAALLTWSDRWDGEIGAYARFAAGYGADLAGDPLARDLARLRLLAPTVNLIARAAGNERYAAEARLRIRYWRGEDHPPAWTPQ